MINKSRYVFVNQNNKVRILNIFHIQLSFNVIQIIRFKLYVYCRLLLSICITPILQNIIRQINSV